jgi:aryl-phospho-beta-D-glucosidase BglC (GH1 family)
MSANDMLFSSFMGELIRATRLDSCGKPLSGLTDEVKSAGFVKVNLSAQIEAAKEYTKVAANGDLLINDMAVGFTVDEKPKANYALEVWADIAADPTGVICSGGEWDYWLVPWLRNPTFGDFVIEEDAVTFSLKATTKVGNRWSRGIHNVVEVDAINTPGLLDAPGVLPSEHIYNRLTSIPPPAVTQNGYTGAFVA